MGKLVSFEIKLNSVENVFFSGQKVDGHLCVELSRPLKLTEKNGRRIRQVDPETKVAFFATLKNHLLHLGAKQSIAFEDVVTNIGSAYNPHVGVFVAPVSGVYVFSVTLMSYGPHTSHYIISKNGSQMSRLYVRGQDAPYEVAAQTAVLQLAKGDDVDIQNLDADEALHGNSDSTFSGFLLYQIYS